ncbi:MAG: hypothetical protein KDI88_08745 [Gammaproteobacteria bacterium]|nr:hypothetical protein [Gammaproteobacteria bacterium]
MSWLTAVLLVAAGTVATLLGLALTAVLSLLVRAAVVGLYRAVVRWTSIPRFAQSDNASR